jgi:hypothetical protein
VRGRLGQKTPSCRIRTITLESDLVRGSSSTTNIVFSHSDAQHPFSYQGGVSLKNTIVRTAAAQRGAISKVRICRSVKLNSENHFTKSNFAIQEASRTKSDFGHRGRENIDPWLGDAEGRRLGERCGSRRGIVIWATLAEIQSVADGWCVL